MPQRKGRILEIMRLQERRMQIESLRMVMLVVAHGSPDLALAMTAMLDCLACECDVVVLVTCTTICRAVSLDNCTFREAEQGGRCGCVENLSTLESWSQEGSGSITKSREKS